MVPRKKNKKKQASVQEINPPTPTLQARCQVCCLPSHLSPSGLIYSDDTGGGMKKDTEHFQNDDSWGNSLSNAARHQHESLLKLCHNNLNANDISLHDDLKKVGKKCVASHQLEKNRKIINLTHFSVLLLKNAMILVIYKCLLLGLALLTNALV